MTLTTTQRNKIYNGIPSILGTTIVHKQQTGQFVNPPTFPSLLVAFLTEGITVRPRQRLRTIFDPANQVWHEVYGEQKKASISCVLESTDKAQVYELADLLAHEIESTELGINPIDDSMQFRGFDPPNFPNPYFLDRPSGRIAIHRCVLDFFVEYEYSWTYDRPLIKEIDIVSEWSKASVPGSGGPISLASKVNLTSFLLDLVLMPNDGQTFSLDMILAR